MVDNLTKEQRSYCMSKIRSGNTKQEIKVRKAVWDSGFRYRIKSKLPGKPDMVFPSKKTAVFLHGCYWHMCRKCYREPKSNKRYWVPKLKRNVKRDKANKKKLKHMGWEVVVVWEHEIKNNFEKALDKILKVLRQK